MVVVCLFGFQCLSYVVKRRISAAMVACSGRGSKGGGVDTLAKGARGLWEADGVAACCWVSIRLIAGNAIRVHCMLVHVSFSKTR